jgi:putative transposase
MPGDSQSLADTGMGSRERNFVRENFWSRGYYVPIVSRDAEMIKAYIKNQDVHDQKIEQQKMLG